MEQDISQNMTSFEYAEYHRQIQSQYGNLHPDKKPPTKPAPAGVMAQAFGRAAKVDKKQPDYLGLTLA